jgi:hypothetical protein
MSFGVRVIGCRVGAQTPSILSFTEHLYPYLISFSRQVPRHSVLDGVLGWNGRDLGTGAI